MSHPISTPGCSCRQQPEQLDLQRTLLQTITGLTQLLSQLNQPTAAVAPVAVPAPRGNGLWDELSVVELRSLLRSYPIDRSSLPAPIELLRRSELIEALHQIQTIVR
jgi:hypothetical protein